MPGKRVYRLALYAALLLTAQLIPLAVSFGSAPCQKASDPNGLLTSISEAEHRAKMSTEMLQLMLPCSGTPVSAGSLAQVMNAGFTPDQMNLILQVFAVTAVPPSDIVPIARTSLPDPEKERIFQLHSPLVVTPLEFKRLDLEGLSGIQIDFIATHLRIRVTEKDLSLLLSIPASSNQSVLLPRCLSPLSLTTEQSVSLLAAYPYRKALSDKITISDPALWAYALKKGFSVSDVSLHLDAGEYEAWEVAGAFQRAGVSNSIITEFLVANEKHISLSDWDVERLSRSSLSDDQVAQIIRALGHPALQLQPSSVARLKARGMDDETILALTREKSLGLSRPVDSQHHGPYRIGGDVSAPVLISKVEPEYSGQARRACLSGAMSLSLVVDSNGIPRDIYVIKPLGMGLNEKAVEAVMKWRFRPGMKGGQPVATWATVEINFRLFGPCQEQPVSQSVDLLSPTNHSTNSISSSQPFSSALPGKRYRDRGEYELFSKVTTTSDPLARLETLYSWENQYRQSDYLNERLQYFVATLAKLAPSNSVLRGSLIQRCNELLKIDPSSFQASYALAFWGPTEGGSHPSPELVAQIKTAAQNITSKVDAIFGSAKIPATVSQAELVNTKSQAVTAAQKALAYVKQVQSDKREISITSGSDLQVEIVQVNWSTSEWGTSGFGKGNLLGNQSKQGFDFAFTCSRPFLPSEGGGYYPGKWKKPNSRLVILTTEIGNAKKHDSCELKVSLEPYAYEVRNSPLTTVPIR